ncbi:MAG: PD-(D/E)XK nuclease family transposase [Clostridiales bacterium]|nr:PD-(D/E)XK nuclease family transposase [Clostridiales bacterium]
MGDRLHEQDLQRISLLRLFDDDFLAIVFENNKEGTELLLNIIFDRNDMNVIKVVKQREIKGVEGYSVRLDISAEDSSHRIYDIEIQRQDRGNLPLRSRYYSSMIDTMLLKRNEDYDRLVPTYVIFFTENDIFGDGKPLRHYVTKEIESNDLLGDERHIMFVNGENKDEETALGKLVHDFKCNSADNMYYDVLANRVRYFKEEGGVRQMCKVLEDMRNEAAAKAAKESAILTLIEAYREFNVAESDIKEKIMKKFDISEAKAKEYMLGRSA